MKLRLLLVLLLFISLSCRKGERSKQNDNPEVKIRKEAAAIADDYALNQLKDGKITADERGFITIKDSLKSYIYDPARIVIGFIDTDSLEDAIVTITSFMGQDINLVEQLILLNVNEKLMLIKSVEADMKILQLKDRIITVEVHTKPRNSPLYNCAACKAIINYKFSGGDLVKIEETSTSSHD